MSPLRDILGELGLVRMTIQLRKDGNYLLSDDMACYAHLAY